MLKTYLQIAFRSLWKEKVFSAISISGLAAGILVSVIIIQFAMHEWSYDEFHPNKAKIYRVLSMNEANKNAGLHIFSAKLAPQLLKDNPEIKNSVRIQREFGAIIKNPDVPSLVNTEKGGLYVDPSFFQVFSFPFKYGNAPTALERPFTMVISEKMAEKYFGRINPVGKKLDYNAGQLFEITGVANNAPSNSTIQFDFLISLDTFSKLNPFAFDNLPNFETFLLIENKNALARIERNVKPANKLIKSLMYNETDTYKLEPLNELRFDGTATSNNAIGKKTLYTISGIAALILSLALFNYINLATARSTIRAKEVGVRKSAGAKRSDLIRQFLMESTLVTFLAFLVGVGLIFFIREPFNTLFGLSISGSFLTDTKFIAAILLLFFGTSFLAGFYPALILSRFSPVKVLKGSYSEAGKGAFLRKSFIVFQFTVSAALIFCSLIISNQITHLSNENLGFNKEQILNLRLGKTITEKSASFKQEVKKLAGLEQVSLSNTIFFGSYGAARFQIGTNVKATDMITFEADPDFVQNTKLKWRIPPAQNAGTTKDGFYLTLNETAMKKLGFTPENVVGQTVRYEQGGIHGIVSGVVKDFNIAGPTVAIKPMLFLVKKTAAPSDGFRFLQVRLDPRNDIQDKLALLESTFRKYDADTPFEFSFVDDDFQKAFVSQTRIANMVRIFTFLAVALASLGLLGLVAFIGQTRMKEISVRKIMGASVTNIFTLLYRDFFVIVLISIVIAAPVAWYAMEQWLNGFASRVSITWSTFLTGGLVSFLIALLTISYHGFKSARINPAKTLRSE